LDAQPVKQQEKTMEPEKQTYKNPKVGTPLISTISSGCKTPLLTVKFCNLLNPFYYPNSPTIPRYSITCIVSPDEHKDFLAGLQAIEINEKVDSIIKLDSEKKDGERLTTGNFLIKFQSKEIIPIYVYTGPESEPDLIELEDELARGEKVLVVYDILRYTKKHSATVEHGLSFKPTSICYYPETQKS
jgi:hypothetical protein